MGDRPDATSYAVYARLVTDPPRQRARRLPVAPQLLPPPQAGDLADAGARPRGPRAAVPADLQARLGPARRRRRGRRVAPRSPCSARSRRSSASTIEPGDLLLTDWLPAVGRLGRRGVPGLRRRHPRRRRCSTRWSSRSARSATRGSARSRRSTSSPPTSPPVGCGRQSRGRPAVYGVRPLRQDASMAWVYEFSEGNKDQKDLLGGKGANLAEMTTLGLPVPPGFTISTETCRAYLALQESGEAAARGPRRGGHRAPRGPRGGDGQAARRRRRPAARLGALGREVLDARDDGDGPQRRPQRHLGRRAGRPQRGRALRPGLLPPAAPDVRRHRARTSTPSSSPRRSTRPSGPRAPSPTSTSTPTTCAASWRPSSRSSRTRPGATSRRTRASRWTSRSARSSTRGTPTAPGSTAARSGSPRTSAPPSTCRRWSSATSAWTPAPASRSPATRPAAPRASTATTSRTRRARTSSPASATPSASPTWPTSTGSPTTT